MIPAANLPACILTQQASRIHLRAQGFVWRATVDACGSILRHVAAPNDAPVRA